VFITVKSATEESWKKSSSMKLLWVCSERMLVVNSGPTVDEWNIGMTSSTAFPLDALNDTL